MRFLYYMAAALLVIGGGLIHGHWSQRWQTSQQLQEAAGLVSKLPMRLGDWQGSALTDLDTQAERAVHRRYQNGERSVIVLLECGRAGHLAAFTPSVLLPNYEIADTPDRRSVKVNGNDMEVMTTRIRPSVEPGPQLRVFASWKHAGGWEAPQDLKWHYRGQPYLYRLYLAYEIAPNNRANESANTELAAEWLGLLERNSWNAASTAAR